MNKGGAVYTEFRRWDSVKKNCSCLILKSKVGPRCRAETYALLRGSQSKKEKYEVVSGKPVIAPIKTDNLHRCKDIFEAVACFVNENYKSLLSSPGVFLSRARIFRLDTGLESQYAPIIQPKSYLNHP